MPDSPECGIDGAAPDGEAAGEAAGAGVTGLNCAGFGSAMVVTATFGMVAAGHLLRKLAAEVAPQPAPAPAPAGAGAEQG